jgi:hypothetical protein
MAVRSPIPPTNVFSKPLSGFGAYGDGFGGHAQDLGARQGADQPVFLEGMYIYGSLSRWVVARPRRKVQLRANE